MGREQRVLRAHRARLLEDPDKTPEPAPRLGITFKDRAWKVGPDSRAQSGREKSRVGGAQEQV
jgi:hypothetical protein